MKEKDQNLVYKSLIEKARRNQTIMGICHSEYLGNYGKFPPDNWEPSDEEILAVIERSGFN